MNTTNTQDMNPQTLKECAQKRWESLKTFLDQGISPAASVAYDMAMMHDNYQVKESVSQLDSSVLYEFLKFRLDFLQEELDETCKAYVEKDAEEIVDGLIDLVVVAVGTLDLYGVDFNKAWFEVLRANMNKRVGVKEGRANPYGLPDLCKPEGWIAPSHAGNYGTIKKAFA
jgi:predicted HAD superfamily Cof-like phosphohydrolase